MHKQESKVARAEGSAIMTNSEIREWIKFACDCNGCPEIADRIETRWSKRMTCAMGLAERERGGRWSIALSVGLFGNATPEERYNTIVHESCHCIRDFKEGTMQSVDEGHDSKWAKLMCACGVKPARYHHVSQKGLIKRYVYVCPNNCYEFKLSTRMHNEIQRGRCRICRKCKGRLQWTGEIEK